MKRLIFSNENLPIKILKSALYCSVNVLSTKVQLDNCILRFHTGDRTAILRGHRSSHAKDQPFAKQRQNFYFAVSCGPCQLYWPDPKGRNRDTLGLQSSALLTELVLLLCFRLSTSKREFSRRTPEIYRRACFLPSWSKVHFL